MGRTYHRRRPEPSATVPPGPGRTRTAWVGRLETWLADCGWAGYLVSGVVTGLWLGGLALLLEVPSRWAKLAAGGALFGGGLAQIFLAKTFAAWRDNTPLLLRWYEEGAGGSIDYGPGSFRFFGSAVAGCGLGAVTWALLPNLTVAVVTGVVFGLAIWVWTWIAFTQIDD